MAVPGPGESKHVPVAEHASAVLKPHILPVPQSASVAHPPPSPALPPPSPLPPPLLAPLLLPPPLLLAPLLLPPPLLPPLPLPPLLLPAPPSFVPRVVIPPEQPAT